MRDAREDTDEHLTLRGVATSGQDVQEAKEEPENTDNGKVFQEQTHSGTDVEFVRDALRGEQVPDQTANRHKGVDGAAERAGPGTASAAGSPREDRGENHQCAPERQAGCGSDHELCDPVRDQRGGT